ncbi:MAG TPA: hypothetical protein DIW81_29795 [Planctomycetaceae bacterium]|nr:hypothetical protein [Planctomycetaceae bacterium]
MAGGPVPYEIASYFNTAVQSTLVYGDIGAKTPFCFESWLISGNIYSAYLWEETDFCLNE